MDILSMNLEMPTGWEKNDAKCSNANVCSEQPDKQTFPSN
jgi:hypothetical protein